MAEALLIAEGLVKYFGRRNGGFRAVDGIDFTVNRGDIYGFLGPNGAGKSTTIRMALGLIHPTAGRVSIGGYDLRTHRLQALAKVGAFVEAPSFYTYLTGRTNLEIFAGLAGGASTADLDRVIELVGLKGRENELVKVYSHGMKQRLGIASCLLPMPELMILDEPTDGLDPHGIHETRELIKRLAREENLTIFLSSHLLGEVEHLCNRIAIVERGRVILQGDLIELEKRYRRFQIEVDRPADAAVLLRKKFKIEIEPAMPRELRRGSSSDFSIMLTGTEISEVNAALVESGIKVQSLTPEQNWLDRLFLQLTSSAEPKNRAAAYLAEASS